MMRKGKSLQVLLALLVFPIVADAYMLVVNEYDDRPSDYSSDPLETTWFKQISTPGLGDDGKYYNSASITGPRFVSKGVPSTEIPERWPYQVTISYPGESLPDTVLTISSMEAGAFAKCNASKFTSLILPATLQEIGDSAFGGQGDYHAYEVVSIPASVRSVGVNAFFRCRPKTVTTSLCYPIMSAFGDSPVEVVVNGLGAGTYDWEHHKDIPANKIVDQAFSSCSNLQKVSFQCDNRIEIIGDHAFDGCVMLDDFGTWGRGDDLKLPTTIMNIGDAAFRKCEKIQSPTYPKYLTSIGDEAFFGCVNLENVTLPSSVKRVGSKAFNQTKFWEKHEDGFVVVDGWLLGYKGEVPSQVQIPRDVKRIADSAFEDCITIAFLRIHSGVEYVGSGAFRNCRNLIRVWYDHEKTEFGTNVFDGCPSYIKFMDEKIELATILFETEGGCPVNSTEVEVGYSIGKLPTAKRDGFAFVGWFTSKEGGEEIDDDYVVQHDMTLYARWTPITYCTVRYDPNGGVIIGDDGKPALGFVTNVACGTAISKLPEVIRSNYSFIGWKDSPSADAQSVYGTTIITDDLTIYAHWRSQLNFYPEGGVCDVLTISCLNDVLSEPFPVPTWDDEHVFIGWFTELGVEKTGISRGDGNMALYAHWKVNRYQVTFDANGGEGGDSIEVEFGSEVLKIAPMVRKTGFEFVGWFTAADGGEQLLPATVVSRDVIYYAHWREITGGYEFGCQDEKDGVVITSFNIRGEASGHVVIPETIDGKKVIGIGRRAFYHCTGLKSVIIPPSVESVGECAFAYCDELESLTISEGVTKIENEAFIGCVGMVSAILPSGVVRIGDRAFKQCIGLEAVTIPEGVKSIGDEAFLDCSRIKSMTLPSSVASVGSYAFKNCAGLESVTIAEGVASLGYEAFRNCRGIVSVALPSSITSLEDCVFEGCSGLSTIVLSEGLLSVGRFCFADCSGLVSVRIPTSVKNIGNEAFENCFGLESVVIPEGLESIGTLSFYGCSKLKSVVIPSRYNGNNSFQALPGLRRRIVL